MQNFHNKTANDTIKYFRQDSSEGYSHKRVNELLSKHGLNKLKSAPTKSLLSIYIDQFKAPLIIILLISAIISLTLGEVLNGIIIITIVLINSVVGATQENKANLALNDLFSLSRPKSRVLREGNIENIFSENIVVGDIVIIEAGDYIPADLRLIKTESLKIDEASLTGEQETVEKKSQVLLPEDTILLDRINMAYMGSIVTNGNGMGIVVQTAMDTELGKIAGILNEISEEQAPMQKSLNILSKNLAIICLTVCGIIFLLGMYRQIDFLDIFTTSVSLAVAAIPEGLTIVVTVILSMGMQRMIKINTLIKKLNTVETLGSTTVICSDKTGTLTQNKMSVQKIFTINSTIGGSSLNKSNADKVSELIKCAVLCNNATFNLKDNNYLGDPTETALLALADELDINKENLNKTHSRISERPFDSDRKIMTTFNECELDDKKIAYCKGAPDEILARCKKIYNSGKEDTLYAEQKILINDTNKSYAEKALRVLGFAYKYVDNDKLAVTDENNFIFLGLMAMSDPLRAEAISSVQTCKNAGIDIKMITGDHRTTATAIGKQLGIVNSESQVITGAQLDKISPERLRNLVNKVSIFARVSPEHKIKIVEAIQSNGNIVAMTGDGVNDAPALKKADIGIAMGITGTEVSKAAANMILTDDKFSSIVTAVREGRCIYNNIQRVISYLLSCNAGEILLIFTAMLFNLPIPLTAIHLLTINIIIESITAFAIGMEESNYNIMSTPPRDPKQPILTNSMFIAILIQSIAFAASSLTCFLVVLSLTNDNVIASSACFATIVLGETIKAYSTRTSLPFYKIKFLSNKFLNRSAIYCLVFLTLVLYLEFLNPFFNTSPLSPTIMLIVVLTSCMSFIIGELVKHIK